MGGLRIAQDWYCWRNKLLLQLQVGVNASYNLGSAIRIVIEYGITIELILLENLRQVLTSDLNSDTLKGKEKQNWIDAVLLNSFQNGMVQVIGTG